jgi:hypothetical protein
MTNAYKDRTAGLICFGVLLILIGLICLLLGGITGLSMWFVLHGNADVPNVTPASAVIPVVLYTGLATLFVWLGIGALMARRWAAALLHVLSVLWLLSGCLGIVVAGTMLGTHMRNLGADADPATRAGMLVGILVGGAMMVVAYVLMPAAIWLFFRSPHVTATCAAKDPRARWTDRCARPVLGAVTAMFLLGLNTCQVLVYPVAPFFGRLATGATAIGLQLGSGLLLLTGALLLYRRRMEGWWIAAILLLLWTISTLVTFQLVEPDAWLQALGLEVDEKMRALMTMGFSKQAGAWVAIWSCGVAGFLLYLKKYLTPASSGGAESA